jgi:GNAT superfamily N-acetyltransferase
MSAEQEELRIAPATEKDVPLLLALIRELAVYERMLAEVEADEDRLRNTLFGPRPCAEAIIAWAGERPLGFALFFQNYSTFLAKPGIYLEDLFVRPEARRGGVGRALLTHLAGVARERGCGRFEWSVLDWNEPAIGFYRKIGARAMDEWTIFRLTGDALEALASGTASAVPAASGPDVEAI